MAIDTVILNKTAKMFWKLLLTFSFPFKYFSAIIPTTAIVASITFRYKATNALPIGQQTNNLQPRQYF